MTLAGSPQPPRDTLAEAVKAAADALRRFADALRQASETLQARAFHRAVGHSCSFCTYQRDKHAE